MLDNSLLLDRNSFCLIHGYSYLALYFENDDLKLRKWQLMPPTRLLNYNLKPPPLTAAKQKRHLTTLTTETERWLAWSAWKARKSISNSEIPTHWQMSKCNTECNGWCQILVMWTYISYIGIFYNTETLSTQKNYEFIGLLS